MVTLDLRGQVCPATLLKSLREMNRMQNLLASGAATLCVLTDHRDATVTIPEMAESMGYAAKVERVVEGHYIVTVGRSA